MLLLFGIVILPWKAVFGLINFLVSAVKIQARKDCQS